jgi:hypothetical protein
VTRIADAGERIVEARRIEPACFDAAAAARRPGGYSPVAPDSVADIVLLDLPTVAGHDGTLLWLAATAEPWPGGLALWRSADGSSFALDRRLARPATIPTLTAALPPGPAGRWDRAGVLIVEMAGGGTLESLGEAAVLDGANALAVRRADGSFEVVQFSVATPVSEGVLRLSGLLRGQLGSDGRNETIPAGADVVLLDEAVVPIVTRPEDLGRSMILRVGPAGVDAGDASVVEVTSEAAATALKPYAPCRITGRRGASGVEIRWIRRTRTGGDSWEGEVPLGEDVEAYEVEILSGMSVRRVLQAAAPAALYASADEIADFGVPQTALALRVFQLSATAGRGFASEVTLNV